MASLKMGVCPFSDGGGFAYEIEIESKDGEIAVWIQKGALICSESEWHEIAEKVCRGISAVKELDERPTLSNPDEVA